MHLKWLYLREQTFTKFLDKRISYLQKQFLSYSLEEYCIAFYFACRVIRSSRSIQSMCTSWPTWVGPRVLNSSVWTKFECNGSLSNKNLIQSNAGESQANPGWTTAGGQEHKRNAWHIWTERTRSVWTVSRNHNCVVNTKLIRRWLIKRTASPTTLDRSICELHNVKRRLPPGYIP